MEELASLISRVQAGDLEAYGGSVLGDFQFFQGSTVRLRSRVGSVGSFSNTAIAWHVGGAMNSYRTTEIHEMSDLISQSCIT